MKPSGSVREWRKVARRIAKKAEGIRWEYSVGGTVYHDRIDRSALRERYLPMECDETRSALAVLRYIEFGSIEVAVADSPDLYGVEYRRDNNLPGSWHDKARVMGRRWRL